jgi:Methyltransferase domain
MSAASHAPMEFEDRMASLDPGLFDLVETQSNAKDRRSWLAVQRAVREAGSSFVCLEIGSYLGGSLQQYLQDPRCRRIYSIDNRTRDERHEGNSEQTMLDNLRRLAPEKMNKLVCFATDAHCIPAGDIDEAPDICFIDGEHTNRAVLSDFAFCLGVCTRDAAIVFHDAGSTRPGIRECLRFLRRSGRAFLAHKLPGNTFVVALWGCPVGSDLRIRRMAVAVNGERWLWTSGMSRQARRRVPSALRPASVAIRNRLWAAP